MKGKMSFLAALMLAISVMATASDQEIPSLPDVSGWPVVNKLNIALESTKLVSIYFGFEVEYQNPSNKTEFVRVLMRHIPLIIARFELKGSKFNDGGFIISYAEKDKADVLQKLFDESDPFLVIKWQTEQDPRTGRSIQSTPASIWVVDSAGKWNFFVGQKVSIGFMSEKIESLGTTTIGKKYSVGDVYHILRANYNDLVLATKNKNGKEDTKQGSKQ